MVVPPLSCAFHRLPGSSATRTIHRPDSTGSVQDSRLVLLLGVAGGQEIRQNVPSRLSARVTLAMDEAPTTVIIQRHLDALPGDTAAEPIVREPLKQAAGRLCTTLLYKSYPRLTRPPVNLETDELLGGIVAGLLTALRTTRPRRCAGSSRCQPSTCAGSSMTWPAAWMNGPPRGRAGGLRPGRHSGVARPLGPSSPSKMSRVLFHRETKAGSRRSGPGPESQIPIPIPNCRVLLPRRTVAYALQSDLASRAGSLWSSYFL